MELKQFLDDQWQKYISITPTAAQIVEKLKKKNLIENDHIAIRTFAHKSCSIEKMKEFFQQWGYEEKGQYHFTQKKLNAIHLENHDLSLPKIFISELILEEFDEAFQAKIKEFLSGIEDKTISHLFEQGQVFHPSSQDYQTILAASEYAAWLLCNGFCANHFTINVNLLAEFKNLIELNSWLIGQGYLLNEAGGAIKGGAEAGLAQSSTLADKREVTFSDGVILEVPTCYFEFAFRYPVEKGSDKLFQGFIESSADKIFESTDIKR